MKKVLIFGVSGQDGAFLARFLLEKGYQVIGTSRQDPSGVFKNLDRLGIRERIKIFSVVMSDHRKIEQLIAACEPDEIYNLAGQSSVARSFEKPLETFESIAAGTLNILESVRDLALPAKIFNAGSGECFGNLGGRTATETTPFNPRNPYSRAKVTAFMHTGTFRQAYNLFACTGILFNHESFLRPPWFVTRKIVKTALAIARGRENELVLGDLSIRRDWGWAPEYVDAMWRMLQQGTPKDYIIATGTSIRLADFVETVFTYLGLDWEDRVTSDPRFFREGEIAFQAADPSAAHRDLAWKAGNTGTDVARLMIEAEKVWTD